MRTTYKTLSLAAIVALLLPLGVLAQKSANAQGPYHDVRIVVKDLDTDQEIGSLFEPET